MTVPLSWSEEDEIYYLAPETRPAHRDLTVGQPGGRSTA
jgi:hypothetical protein